MKNVLNTNQFSKAEVEAILKKATMMERECKSGKVKKLLEDKIVASIFFEPSTRTRLSFETAALKLGAHVITAEDASTNSSAYKGETIEDTARMLSAYADVIVMRHCEAGAAEKAAKTATKPVINAGDGANQHPSQGLLDLYTIKKEHGRLENLNIAFGGDLLYSRTLRSLMPLLNFYKNNKFYFVSPKELRLPAEYLKELKKAGMNFTQTDNLEEVMPQVDVLYMTRVQKERFKTEKEYNKVKNLFILKVKDLKKLKKSAIIMHPLPKINEIEHDVDLDPRAAYFRQAENGVYVRMALLCYSLGL